MEIGIGIGLTFGQLTLGTPWVNNRSVLFDGVDEFVTTANAAGLDEDGTDPFSVSIWCKQAAASGGATQALCGKNAGALEGWALRLDTSDRPEFIISSDWATADMIRVHSDVAIADTNWHHIAVTYDGGGAASGVTIYIDGNPVATTTDTDALTGSAANAGFFRLARAASAAEWYAGYLDEFSKWSIELTAGNITALYNSGVPKNLRAHAAHASLTAWYGDAFSFPTMYAQVDTKYNGTMTNMEAGDITTEVPA